jgi:hypothetical protein
VAQQSTIIEELVAAGRGVFALLVGDKQAGGWFDFSQRGLYGSFIALLVVTAISACLPIAMGENAPGDIARSVIGDALLFAFLAVFATIVLGQLKRVEALSPYLVAFNWAWFFLTLILSLVVAAGFDSDFALIVLAILVIVIEVNIARLIMTLSPLQVAIFMVAQLVGVLIGLAFIGMLFPLPPDAVAQTAA